jgi:hypothetical protein
VGDDLPHNLQSLLEKRLDALTPNALIVLQACAVLGENANTERIGQLLGLTLSDLATQLQELELASLLSQDVGGLRCRHPLLQREALHRLAPSVARALHAAAARVLGAALERHLDLALAQACLFHMADAQEPTIGVRLAVRIARRFLDSGMPNEARLLSDAAEALHPVGAERAAVLGVRLFASRAAGDWRQVSITLSEIDTLQERPDDWDDGEVHRIAFDAGKFVGDFAQTTVASQLALLANENLSPGATKLVGINALIACCDDFNRESAQHVFASHFRPFDSRLASVEDLVGNLIFHTCFGSLDTATDVAYALSEKCMAGAAHGFKRTQLIRWCARPFHMIGDEGQSKLLLDQACAAAKANGQPSEAHECLALVVLHALDLEDAVAAAKGLLRLEESAATTRSEFAVATLQLLKLRQSVLTFDAPTAERCLREMSQCHLPNCNRVRFTMSGCQLLVSHLLETPPSDEARALIFEASYHALSSIDMDWTIAGACTLGRQPQWNQRVKRLVRDYIRVRRPRYPTLRVLSLYT